MPIWNAPGSRSRLILAALASAAFINLLWGLSRPALIPAGQDIVIGVSNAQSGAARFAGRDLVAGSEAYFKRTNANGGIGGRMIRTVVEDDRYEPDPAVRNTNDLITRQHVFFLFDYVGTPTLTHVLPLLKYYERERIVNVAPLTGADPQRQPPYDRYVFNIRASYREETQALVDYLYGQGYRRIGFFGQADAFGKTGEVATAGALAKHGLKLVETVSYRRGTLFDADFRPQVEILRSSGVDAIVAFAVYDAWAAFIRDARLAGWQAPIANVSNAGASELLEKLLVCSRRVNRDLLSGVIGSAVVPAPSQLEYPLVAKFRAGMPLESRSFVALEGWLNATVVCEALRRMRPNGSREDFAAALESLDGWDPGLGLKLTFSPACHQGLHKVWLARASQTGWIPLDPAAATK